MAEIEMESCSHFDSDAPEVTFGSTPDRDQALFKLATTTSFNGVPMGLMRGPRERPAGTRDPAPVREWRTPTYAGLNALARGLGGLTPLQDTLLVWYRTGERQDVVLRAVAARVRDWGVELWQAEYLVRMSLLHARWPEYRFTPLPHMSVRKFRRLLRVASGWIRDELTIAHAKLARTHSTLMSELELRRFCENRIEGARKIHYPTRPNVIVWKSPQKPAIDALGGASQFQHENAASQDSTGRPFPGQSRANRVMLAAPPRPSASKTTAGPPVKGGHPSAAGTDPCKPNTSIPAEVRR